MRADQIAAAYPQAAAVIGPIIAVLAAESLIEDIGVDIMLMDGIVDHTAEWRVSDYGHKLLAFVRADDQMSG
jgi:hypothetical protein